MKTDFNNIKQQERELLLRLRDGDEKAFASLFYAYKDKLYGFLFGMTKSDAKAKDLVQDVFLKVWQNRANMAEIDNFNAYIYSVAQNQAVDQFRKSSKELFSNVELLNSQEADVTPDPVSALINKETREKIDEAVNQLPPQQKKIFVLHNEYGFKHHEIAEQLNISVSTTQNHMREALKNIRIFLSHSYFFFTILALNVIHLLSVLFQK
ncbi:RNA polymerase, sigma-24 subunit, ECF subfamily [Paludibacter propionicigenes WB4]|uniref:RNA polymerase, sigma-24 subunit, ECF subfamily n=1 Tax=Paludibacter propionicigenes (strain DSM 17365 / JCM 13257 / WB4) TaxID=694427 RepID=E4T7F4_PALPW|nr:RNA polymerase sigma factor [Paludibacter propionicigenes]ADQ80648.1 RNA polymerase, sigma-24 subunit, ECF subfamily [Paludibacter propionicigenes WB4]